MNKTTLETLLLISIAGSLGCGSGSGTYTPTPVKKIEVEKVNEGDGKLLFPVAVGNTWTYSVESVINANGQTSKTTDSMVFEIVGVTQKGTGSEVKLRTTVNNDPSKSDVQTWLVDDRGVFQVTTNSKGVAYTPPQPTFLYPIKAGTNFTWKGQGPNVLGKTGSQSYTGTMFEPQLVDTQMGQMTGIGIEANGTFSDPSIKQGKVKVLSYWAKNIGLIRYRQETLVVTSQGASAASANVLVLKSYQLKK